MTFGGGKQPFVLVGNVDSDYIQTIFDLIQIKTVNRTYGTVRVHNVGDLYREARWAWKPANKQGNRMPMKAVDVAGHLLKHPMTTHLVEAIVYTHDRIHPISNNHHKVLFLKMKKGEDGEPLHKGGDGYLTDEQEPPEIMAFPTEIQVLVQGQERGKLVLSFFHGFEYCSSSTHGEDTIARLNHISCMCYGERMLQAGGLVVVGAPWPTVRTKRLR
ncbi:hypothetical protein CYMTET_51720 [Cymbomonas tetramitiformis]|uniref:Uncharacterized protein n=1 Tax=Cymbomonas tetramitiformis TaxID=36881 RepID=A0AAE0ERI4_9CHLO|nr:hypothetical protein CYMTET_51720 [Cymbomonas tetramitiformis]